MPRYSQNLAINETIFSDHVTVYLNLAQNFINIDLPNEILITHATLIDTLWQVLQNSISKKTAIGSIQNGFYFLHIKTTQFDVNKRIFILR